MPQVPYNPVPTAQPSAPGEGVSVNTPGAAFGENIGQALQGLGTTTEQVGGELFARAIALQNLANENEARQAQTEYATQASLLHAEYNAKTGKDAADSLPAYLDSQRQLRESIGNRLSSPMARKFYDADSLPFMQRNVFSAAGHAADQNKQYTIGTIKAVTDVDAQAVGNNPKDDLLFERTLRKSAENVKNAVVLQKGINDADPDKNPLVVAAVQQETSRLTRDRILGINKTDPVAADQMFKKYGDNLTAEDKLRIEGSVEGHSSAIFGVNIARSILGSHLQPDGSYDMSPAKMEEEARAKAQEQLPDNPTAPETAARALSAKLYQDRRAAAIDVADAKKQFQETLAQGGIQDVQQFLATPGADKLVSRLPPNMRTAPQIQAAIDNFNKAANRMTEQRMLTIANGMRTDSTDGGKAFMEQDFSDPKWHLSQQHIRQLQDQQYKMSMHPESDPSVQNAMRALTSARGAELRELHVDRFSQDYSNDYYHFRGALQQALNSWQADHGGKPPSTADVVDTIGPMLIKTQTTVPGFFNIGGYGTTNQEPAFKHFQKPAIEDIPQQLRDQITNDLIKAGHPAPTEQELLRVYTRQLFNDLYKKSSPAQPPKAKPSGQSIPD